MNESTVPMQEAKATAQDNPLAVACAERDCALAALAALHAESWLDPDPCDTEALACAKRKAAECVGSIQGEGALLLQVQEVLVGWLGIDHFEDDHIAPPELVANTRRLLSKLQGDADASA